MKAFITALFCLFVPFLSFAEENEIQIHLHTQEKLASIYMGKIQMEQPHFPKDYANQLHSVLHFDLSYNGLSKVIGTNELFEKVLSHKDARLAFNPDAWKQAGAAHVIKLMINQKSMDVFIYSLKDNSLKQFNGIPLTGDLLQDRRQMHQLADAIQKSLFAFQGISNTRILYSVQAKKSPANPSGWNAEIWECDWDGANARQVTYENSYCITPVMIPNDSKTTPQKFIYVSYKIGQPKIFLAGLKEKTGKRLLDLKGNQLLPAISPKRNQVAFICDASGRTDLFIQDLNPNGFVVGKPKQLFSFPQATQASPTYNHDGSKIAFVSDKDGSPRIYIIPTSMQGGKRPAPVLISKHNKESTCPSWSPDGKKLAYSAKTNGIRQIWIYDCITKEEKQLTFGPGNKENPCWAPDSLHLVFNSTDPSSSELYVVNLNQPDAIQITKGPGIKHYPFWSIR